MLKYCLDRYNTQKIYNKAIDIFLPTLKFVTDSFVTSKMIKKLDDALFANDDINFVNEDSNYVTFFNDERDFFRVDHDKINLDDVGFIEDDPGTIIHVRLMA